MDQDCKSFRIGNSCCEFICLDDTKREEPNIISWGTGQWIMGDLGLRLVIVAVTGFLSLALLMFLFYRLRKRRLHYLAGKSEYCATMFSDHYLHSIAFYLFQKMVLHSLQTAWRA